MNAVNLTPYPRPLPAGGDESELLLELLDFLLSEGDLSREVPEGAEERRRLFRALRNIRPPAPVPEEILRKQDRVLYADTMRRGVVLPGELHFLNGIALWRGDITRLQTDGIVNAGNAALLGCFHPLHSCIDNVIHSAAGMQLREECARLMRGRQAEPGGCVATRGYNLPARCVLHTVGPQISGKVTGADAQALASCYRSCLDGAERLGLSTLAFCCISTGVYGYPQQDACRVAVRAVREWQAAHGTALKVVFDVFTEEDEGYYERELR